MANKLRLLPVDTWDSWAQLPGASARHRIESLGREANEGNSQSSFKENGCAKSVAHESGVCLDRSNDSSKVKCSTLADVDLLGPSEGRATYSSFLEAFDCSLVLCRGMLLVAENLAGIVEERYKFLVNVARVLSDKDCCIQQQFRMIWPPFECVGLPMQDKKTCMEILIRLFAQFTKEPGPQLVVTFGASAKTILDILLSESGYFSSEEVVAQQINLPSIDLDVLSEYKKAVIWNTLKAFRGGLHAQNK